LADANVNGVRVGGRRRQVPPEDTLWIALGGDDLGGLLAEIISKTALR
jgi:hypothetical protein